MHCPKDGTPLQARQRGGVDIDYCPTCRGVWLDRGELEKIISATLAAVSQPQKYNRERDRNASFVGELFDF